MAGVAVSILNHGASAETHKCVASVLRAAQVVGESCPVWIRVLDNGSPAADLESLKHGLAQHAPVQLDTLTENVGFAAGHNHNLRAIFRQWDPDYVWLLNNDCEVGAECVRALLSCAAGSPKTAIWGATLLEEDGRTVQCAGGCRYSSWLSTYRQLGQGKNLASLGKRRFGRFDYIAGASLFMPASMLREGLLPAPRHPQDDESGNEAWLNETFFLYFEELDLARRLKPGLSLGWCREALVIHTSAGKTPGEEARAEYHSSLSALKFTWLYYRGRLLLTAPARFLLKTCWNLLRLKWRLLSPMIAAYRDFEAWRRRG